MLGRLSFTSVSQGRFALFLLAFHPSGIGASHAVTLGGSVALIWIFAIPTFTGSQESRPKSCLLTAFQCLLNFFGKSFHVYWAFWWGEPAFDVHTMSPLFSLTVHRIVIGGPVEPHEGIKNALFVAHAGVSGSLIDALLSPVHEVIDFF